MKTKNITSILLIIAFVFFSLNNLPYSFAQAEEELLKEAIEVKEELEETEKLEETVVTFPYEQIFRITAYYSPLEGQEKYVTGTYAGDIRLNGSGVKSADGTPVYPGMIAAPKTYPFGMKMRIPGIGTVAVHDRGGAIVHAGERGQNYDRLDVWMGYGDIGLTRALNWGARNIEVTVLGVDDGINENVYLEGFSEAEKFIRNVIARPKIFTRDIWYGETGHDVEKLQKFLADLGYYNDLIDGVFGASVKQAILDFQIDYSVVDTIEDFGAGHFGPNTRLKIEAVNEKRKESDIVKDNMGKGSSGDNVKFLQESLKKLGYTVSVTGIYDEQTVDAVFKFQLDHKIIDSINKDGAGFFGPKTFQILINRLVTFNNQDLALKSYKEKDVNDNGLLISDLQFGDQGPAVYKLQEELGALNFLRIAPTGYFGRITEHAVFKFQQHVGLIAEHDNTGAGVFGPITRAKMNEILASRIYTERLIAAKRDSLDFAMVAAIPMPDSEQVEDKIAEEPLFVVDLDPGDRDELVKKLQVVLKSLGYFKGMVTTDYFGIKTQEALLAFQIDNGIVTSESDQGAGRLGSGTRELLNQLL